MPKRKTSGCNCQPLLDRTLELIELHHGTEDWQLSYRQIAEGAGVEREWLSKLAQGVIPNPGVVNVQKVHDFLASRQVRAA